MFIFHLYREDFHQGLPGGAGHAGDQGDGGGGGKDLTVC